MLFVVDFDVDVCEGLCEELYCVGFKIVLVVSVDEVVCCLEVEEDEVSGVIVR